MNITYDPDAKAVYIKLKDGRHLRTITVQPEEEINIDILTSGEAGGIEILNVESAPTVRVLKREET